MQQSVHERQREIRETVESMSIPRPDYPDEGLWYGIRSEQNYYRYTTDDTADDGPLYDVWLNAETRRNTYGGLEVTIAVVLFDCRAHFRVCEETVYSGNFNGHQPTEQAFLLNAHHYEQQARELAEAYYENAEFWADEEEYNQ